MFQFTRFASLSYVFTQRYPCGWVSPFRYLGINAYLPAPPSFSQAITSFVAYHRQGIHHMLLVTWPYNFDFFCKNPKFNQATVCQVFHLTRYAVMWMFSSVNKTSFDLSLNQTMLRFTLRTIRHYLNPTCFSTKSKFVLTQSKLSSEARSVLNLYECTVSSDNADFDSMNC